MAKSKSYRKFIATSATATLVATAVAPVAGLAATDFSDVSQLPIDEREAIDYLVGKGVIDGKPGGLFDPYANMKRAEVAKVLAELKGLEESSESAGFNDVKGHWAEGYINAAAAAGLVEGKGDGKFDPEAPVKRSEFAQVIVRAYELEKVDGVDNEFTDIPENYWGTEAIEIMYSNGLIKGKAADRFAPEEAIQRNHVALMAYRTDVEFGKKPVLETKVDSVTASNGKLTVQMTKELDETPISSDFKIVQNINGTTKAVSASSVAYERGSKTVSLVVPEISATEVDQNVSYTVAYKETAPVSSNSFTIEKVGELKATGVTVLSSTQIKVQFNQKVTKASAEAVANYKLGKAKDDGKVNATGFVAFSQTNPTIKLQEDEQSVIITLADDTAVAGVLSNPGHFDNNTTFLLEVSNNVLPKYGKAAEGNAQLPFTINDSAKPTVDKFAVNEAGDLVVTFNEKLDATQEAKVVINGQALSKKPAYSNGKSTLTFTKAELTGAKPTGFGLELGKTYAVSVADAKDVYGNTMNIYTSNFTYATVAEAPQVTKVESKNEKSVTVTFSEPVYKIGAGNIPLDEDSFNITKGAKHFSPANVKPNADRTVYTLEFTDLQPDFIFDSYKGETSVNLDIHVSDIKDNVGNITPASKHSVTVLKDTVKPEVVKSQNKEKGKIDLTFNKAFHNSVTDAAVAAKSYVLTSTGAKIPLATGDVTNVTLTPEGKLAFDLAAVGTPATTLADGNYTLVIEAGAVVDTALNGGNKNNEIRVPFIIAADGLENKPKVTNVVANNDSAPGDIVVTFAEQVSYESAAKAANYTLDGTAIPAASEFALDSTGKVLTITLPEATYKESGTKVIKINNVRNLAGTVMDEYEAVIDVNENEKIELTSAVVQNGDIILTFNEDVNAASVAQTFVANDFNIKINGVALVDAPTVVDHDGDKEPKVKKNQLRITPPAGTSFATGTITIEVKEDAKAKDRAGNGTKAVTVTATR